jgi:hypothetical protein
MDMLHKKFLWGNPPAASTTLCQPAQVLATKRLLSAGAAASGLVRIPMAGCMAASNK